jgi:amino acid permease
MDWSAVYEDMGEEEGDWEREEVSSTRTHMLQILQLEGKYGPVVCYAFTVNYILGVGCLGIPYAFLQCGIVLGSLLVILLSAVSYMTVMWVAQTYQLELMMDTYLSNSNPFILSPVVKMKVSTSARTSSTTQEANKESQPLLGATIYKSISNFGAVLQNTAEKRQAKQIMKMEIGKTLIQQKKKDRRSGKAADQQEHAAQLEVTDLALEYLGPYGKISYQVSLMLLTYVGLLAYTQVFNNSFISQLWPASPEWLPALLFGAVVVPLSCFDLAEQVTVQVAMSLLRFLSLGMLRCALLSRKHCFLMNVCGVGILLVGTIAAYIVDPPGEHSSSHTAGTEPPPLFQLSGFSVMFTTAIFSQLFQHSVPGLIAPLAPEHRKYVPTIFKAALATTSLIYISTGCMCVLYFGQHLQQSVNLNFVGFTWGMDPSDTMQRDSYIWSHDLSRAAVTAVAMVVVLFPALDTLSVFPLIANTLGNNLNSAFPGLSSVVKHSGIATERAYVRRVTLILWRLIAAIPPILLSVYVHDLILSLQLAGLCGIVVALVTPALLQRQCEFRSSLIPMSLKANSPIPQEFSSKRYSVAVLVLGGLAGVIALCQMLQS